MQNIVDYFGSKVDGFFVGWELNIGEDEITHKSSGQEKIVTVSVVASESVIDLAWIISMSHLG